VATHDDRHPEMLDEELLPHEMHLELDAFVHRQGEWASDAGTPKSDTPAETRM
jgi:hypothetical protein